MAQAFNLTAQLNLRGPSNIRNIVSDIRRQLGTIRADVNLRIDPNANRNIAQLSRTLQTFNNALQTTRTAANDAASAISNLSRAINSASLQNVPRNINNVGAATQRLGQNATGTARQLAQTRTEMEEFGRQSALAIRRFAAFTTVTTGVFALTNAIRQGLSEFIAFDKELVKLQQVTGESANGLRNLVGEITSLSSNLGVSSADLIQVSSTLAQAGLTARDTERALKALALSALAPSFDDLSSTVEGSIALMRQFGIEAKDLEGALGSVNAVAAKFAVEAGDIISAIQRTGGVFAAASRGVSEGTDALNEFIAVFTSVRATTRESAETIATGLRTIFTRIQRGGTIEALKEFGVNLTDAEGKFVGAYKAVELLSRGLNQIDPRDLKFSQIVEELGGFRQIGKVIPLIQQFATAQQALAVAQAGQNSLAEDAAVAQLSLANQISKVREEFLALMRELGGSDTFQNLAKGALSLASGLIQVADSVKGVLPALTALMAIRGASAALQFGSGFMGGLRRSGGARGLGNRMGGGGQGFASGGYVPGSGNRDTVPAMLTPGEFVIRKKAVEKIGVKKLEHINKYATGGPVMASKLKSVEVKKRVKSANSNIDESEFRKGTYLTDSDSIIFDKYEYGLKSSKNIGWGDFEKAVGKKIGGKPVGGNAPIDIPINKKKIPIEVRNRNQTTKDPELLDKLLRYKISIGQPLISNKKTKDNNLYAGKIGVTYNTSKIQRDRFTKLNIGGYIQKFMAGGAAKTLKQPATLSPQNLLIGPGYLKEREWSGTLRELISQNGLVSDDLRTLSINGQRVSLKDAFSTKQLSSAKLEEKIGRDNIAKLEKLRADVAAAYSGKRAVIAEANRPRTPEEVNQAQKKNLLFGAAGMYGSRFPATQVALSQADGLKNRADVTVFGALLDRDAAEKEARLKKRKIMLQAAGVDDKQDLDTAAIKAAPTAKGLSKFFGYKASVTGVSKANKKLAIDTVDSIAKSLSPATSGSQIFLDFDKTLSFGSDKIGPKINKKKPDYSAFGDPKQIAQGLAKAKLSGLGLRLRKLVGELNIQSSGLGNELLRRMFVVSARPPKTMPLIARWLRNQGLRIPPGNVSGVGGTGMSPDSIALSKAEKIAKMSGPGSVFIDDDARNIEAARNKNINSIQYGSTISKKAKRQAAQQEGLQFEQFISEQLPAKLKTGIFNADGEGIDFPFGLGSQIAQYWFKDARLSNVPVDTKRTLTGPRGKIKKNIISYLKAQGYANGGFIKFARGGGARLGARNKFKELTQEEISQLSTVELIKYGKRLARNIFTTGGAGMATGHKFIEVPQNKIVPELESSLVTYNGKKGFWQETVSPFGREAKVSGKTLDKPNREQALKKQVDKHADEVAAREQKWSSITSGSSIDKYLMSKLSEPILSDYKSARGGGSLAKAFHNTRLRKAVNEALESYDDFDYSPGNIDKLVSGMAMKRFAAGGSAQDTVPALLTPGEFVINKKAARRIGSAKLHQLNRADKIQRFNSGGIVQRFAKGGSPLGTLGVLEKQATALFPGVTSSNQALKQLLATLEQVRKQAYETARASGQSKKQAGRVANEAAAQEYNTRAAAAGAKTGLTAKRVQGLDRSGYLRNFQAAAPKGVDRSLLGGVGRVTRDFGKMEDAMLRAANASVIAKKELDKENSLKAKDARIDAKIRAKRLNPTISDDDLKAVGDTAYKQERQKQKKTYGADLKSRTNIAKQKGDALLNSYGVQTTDMAGKRLSRKDILANTQRNIKLREEGLSFNKNRAITQRAEQIRADEGRTVSSGRMGSAWNLGRRALGMSALPVRRSDASINAQATKDIEKALALETKRGSEARKNLTTERQNALGVRTGSTGAPPVVPPGGPPTGRGGGRGSAGGTGRRGGSPVGPTGGGPPDDRGLGTGSASTRARARQLRSEGLQGQDLRNAMGRESISSKLRNGAFGLSFALPMIMDQFQNQNPQSKEQASSNAMMGGVSSAVGSAMMLGSMGGKLGIAAGLVTAGIGISKAFIDAKNAADEFSKNMAKEKLQSSSEKVANILEEISKKGGNTPEALDRLNKELKNTILAANEAGSMTRKSSMVQDFGLSNILAPLSGMFGLQSAADGSTDNGSDRGALNRSMILEQKGIFAYLKSTSDKNFELNTMTEIAPKLAQESSKVFAIAADSVNSVLRKKFTDGASISDIFKDPAWAEQANVIARSNAEINRQILLIESDTRLTEDEIKARRGAIVAAYAESKAREQFKVVELEKNMRALEDSIKSSTFSFNRMFQNMNNAISASSDGFKRMNEELDLATAALSGQAKIGNASGIQKAIDVLRTPKGYSVNERTSATSMGASIFGGQGSNIQKIITASSKIEDIILSAINQSGANTDTKATNEAIGAKLENAIRSKLTKLGIPPELADKIGKQINAQIGELRKDGEDKIDFAELVEKIPGLSQSVDMLKNTNNEVISALEKMKEAFDAYAAASDQIVQIQTEINNKFRLSQNILTRGTQALTNALGKRVSMRQQLDAVDQPIRSMTGGTNDPAAIRANITRLKNSGEQLRSGMIQAQNKNDLKSVQDFNQQLIRNNVALRENVQALETLANSGEKASIALDEINRIQQKQQSATGLVERLTTSSPQELNSLQNAMFRLERNMRGQANFGSSSDQRRESLDLFNQIAPLLGDRQGELKANVLESQLAESGIQETPFIRNVLESLRNPESDPEMKAATDAYRAAIIEQSRANVQLALINNTLATNIATQTAEAIKKAIVDTRIKFDDAQLKDLLNGINNIPQGQPAAGLALGGVVYKAMGGETFVPRGTDTVPAMLTPGEFVVNKTATQKNLPLLKSINRGTSYYAGGGLVENNFLENSKVQGDLDQARTTVKTYKTLSSDAYGVRSKGTKIVGFPASAVPAKSSPTNPMYDLMQAYVLGKSQNGEEITNNLANKTLDLKPDSVIPGYAPMINSTPGTSGTWTQGGTPRPTWTRDFLSAQMMPQPITIADGIMLSTDYIATNNKSLWTPEKQLFDNNLKDINHTNYDDKNPMHAAISVQRDIAHKLKTSLEKIDADKISKVMFSKTTKYPDRDWMSTKLAKETKDTLRAEPAIARVTYPFMDQFMNVQAVPMEDGNVTEPTRQKSSKPILTAVKGNYGKFLWGNIIRGDIGYDNDEIFGETTDTQKLITEEKLKQFAENKKTYIDQLTDQLGQLDEAATGKFVDSGSTQLANSSMTLLNQLVNDSLSGLYISIPSDQLKQEWKNKGPSLNIFRRSVLTNWKTKLEDLKEEDAKIYQVNDPAQLTIKGEEFAWASSSNDADILQKIVARFNEESLSAKENFVSAFSRGPSVNIEGESRDGTKFGFSYTKLKIPKLSPDTGFNPPKDNSILEGIILEPSKSPQLGRLNPFIEEPSDKSSFRFMGGADIVDQTKQLLADKITLAKDAINKKKNIGPTAIPNLLKLLPVRKTQTSSWIADEDFDKAFYTAGSASPINLYDQLNKLKAELEQQAFEEKASSGEQAKTASAELSSDTTAAIAKNSVPLGQQILKGVLAPKAGILGSFGWKLFPIKVFQDIMNMSNYLGGVSKYFGRQIVKPVNKKVDPRLPPQQQQFTVEPKLAEAWGSIEASRELFNDLASQSYSTLGNYIIPGVVPTIDITKLQEYAKNRGLSAAAFLNAKGSLEKEFNDQSQKEVAKIVDPKKGAIEQAVIDEKTGNLSYKAAETPTTLLQLGKLALGPYNIMPWTKREALLDQTIKELTKINATAVSSKIAEMKPWYKLQDEFLESKKNSIDDFISSSSNAYPDIKDPKVYSKYAKDLQFLAPDGSLGVLPDKEKLEQMAASRAQKRQATEPQKVSKGGVIYAQTGTLVNYEPRGTDTVPAMLTPGEFVVNRRATQKNLPLLKSINSGQYNKGGKIGYLSNGGVIIPQYHSLTPEVSGRNKTVGVSNLQLSLDKTSLDVLSGFNTGFGTNVQSLVSFGTTFGQNINAISTLTSQLQGIATTLNKLSIPEQINITAQHKVEVVINGAQALNGIQDGMKDYVVSSVNTAISKLNVSTDNAFGESSNKILKGPIA